MPAFGKRSLDNLKDVHPLLRKVADAAIRETDFTVICGHRDKAGQDAAVKAGTTKVSFGNSAHNPKPACAIDVIPYPFTNWNDPAMLARWQEIADVMRAEAKKLGISIRWGGDWDGTGSKKATNTWDKPHFELHPWRSFAKG